MSDEQDQNLEQTENNNTEETAQELSPAEAVANILAGKSQDAQSEGEPKAESKEEPKEEEAPKDEKKAEEDRKFAAKFAALSKRDKALREKEKAMSAKEKALEARIAELEANAKKPAQAEASEEKEPLERRLKKDPFATLAELGLDFDVLTKIALNEGKLTPEMQLKLQQEEIDRKYESKLEALERRLKEKEEQEEAAKKAAAEEAALKEFKGSIAAHVKSDPVAYEMLAIEGEEGLDIVFDVINKHYEATGNIMSVKEAADAVEEHLLEAAKKYTSLSKIKGLLGGANPAPAQEAKPAAPKGSSTTLSNQQASVVPAKPTRQLSREEEFAEAAKLLRFNQ